jgi:predicted membrane-bound spermidine synthase
VTAALSAIFFLSGCAALLFESLWFRQAHLAFGSSVWASSLVLSSFMAGVALGSSAAARFGVRVRSALVAYALLELVVGVLGIALVLVLPRLGTLMVPLFRPVLETGAVLQPLRFALSFVLLLGPSAAMGATLPLLVRELTRRRQGFGSALGALYGWNTLGGVCGALAGEVFLLSPLGVVRTGAVAAGLNLMAALAALVLARSRRRRGGLPAPLEAPPEGRHPARSRSQRSAGAILLASFLAGALLLALEVVWFRLLLLFVLATSRAFAVLLGVVLAGIALGSLVASVWMRRDPGADRVVGSVALAAGVLGIFGYWVLAAPLSRGGAQLEILSPIGLLLASLLMLPVSAASGLLFALLGKALNDSLGVPVRSAGLLVLANTLGAAIGPIVACFLLLPWLGVEHSIFLLCASYGGVALLCVGGDVLRSARRGALPALAFVVALVAFPFGRMEETYLPTATEPLLWPGARIVAVREGLTETVQYSRLSFLGEPVGHQLFTNGYRMAGSGPVALRYMSLYVHIPVALHPGPRDALLISYGVGNTARSLTRVEGLRSIHIVDTSREILEMSEVVFPDPAENPTRDSRVTVHVEDGRYFLKTTSRSFDLISGEPPPPRVGNVTYLYTQEYFQLAHDRLRRGGLISYWLPVDQLTPEEAASIAGAFCAVFEDCSLWNGGSLNWTLIGSRGGVAPLDERALRRQWLEGPTAADLRAIGVESPEALGALFIADAEQLRELSRLAPPLRDDFPLRIRNAPPTSGPAWFVRFQDSRRCRRRFADSAWIQKLWPDGLYEETLRQFRLTGLFDRIVGVTAARDEAARLGLLRTVLETSELETLPVLALGGIPRQVEVAQSWRGPTGDSAVLQGQLAMAALARREWSDAAARYRAAAHLGARGGRPLNLAIYAYCRAGENAEVDSLRREVFESGAALQLPHGLRREPGIGGCWAAAWEPGWQRE